MEANNKAMRETAAKRDCEYPKAQSLDADKLTGKTISGLVTDLRQIAKYHYARGNIVQGQFARVMADRIEAAAKREAVTGHGLGNAAEMHKALENIVKVGYPHNFQHEAPHIRGYCYDITDAITKCFEALAAAPRNCDVFSKAEVLKVLDDRSFSKEDTIEWLYSTAEEREGGNNGGKRHGGEANKDEGEPDESR